MSRVLLGFAISIAVGAVVAFAGLERWLPEGIAGVPPVPAHWAAQPSEGRVDVTLVSSQGLVDALADGLTGAERAHHRPGALALVDGRVFAVSGASARQLLRALAWDRLPIEAHVAAAGETSRFAAPQPASLGWRAQRHAYLGLRSSRDLLAAHPGFGLATLGTAILLLLHAFLRSVPRRGDALPEVARSPWRRRRAEQPVRVVLVPDLTTLAQVRVAIGEEHVVAASEHAFAFADGWILAAHKGSVFELVGELGWRMRPIEMATRSELVGEGHALSPLAGDEAGDPLGLLEALHVCGPVAHGTVPRLATSAVGAGS